MGFLFRVLLVVAAIQAIIGCSGGGGGASPPQPPAAPGISSLAPTSVPAGSGAFVLTVNGNGFQNNASVRWNGSLRATTFVSNSQLTAQILPTDVTTQGTAQITVANGTGGGLSAPANFTVSPPIAIISSVSPIEVRAGIDAFTLVVNGINFRNDSIVRWNGGDRLTDFSSSTRLSAQIFAQDVSSDGTAQIMVFNPGIGVSNAFALPIRPAVALVPVITDLSPAEVLAGGPDFELIVRGANFLLMGSLLRINGGATSQQFVSSTEMRGTVISLGILQPKELDITVINTPPGGGTSNVIKLRAIPGPPPPGEIERISVATDGTEANGLSLNAGISNNGRFVAFSSQARNLVPEDTSSITDVFVRDTCFGAAGPCSPTTVRVSKSGENIEANDNSSLVRISPDGRLVFFTSRASNLVPNDTNNAIDLFVHDRDADEDGLFDEPSGVTTTKLLLRDDDSGIGSATFLVVSGNSRYVAFQSFDSDLVPGDTNGTVDVFLRDTCFHAAPGCTPLTQRVSVASDGSEARSSGSILFPPASTRPSISGDGRYVGFSSLAKDLVANDPNTVEDTFLHDTCIGAEPSCSRSTILLVPIDGATGSSEGAFSADARFFVFRGPPNLLPRNGPIGSFDTDIYVRDTCIGALPSCTPVTVRASVNNTGEGANRSSLQASISPDGRYVTFNTDAANVAPADTNGQTDYFLRDTCLNAPPGCIPSTIRLTVANDGTQSEGEQGIGPAARINSGGLFVVFSADASNLVPNDTNRTTDIFRVRTRP